ncbi:glycosyl transferase family 1 [Sphingobacterium gobiense]|uniref:Glycosyl transferase family 1 n=1 Tax=Sphingobacterium gobiense TaxID=1382456 RepID=A0A2S9JVZ9_9SPHI|nr:glycosyl transferase family 1 [Sphingobacterium gobiense]
MSVLQLGKFYPIRGGVEKVMYDLTLGLSERVIPCDMLCATTENHPTANIDLNDFSQLMVVPTRLKLAATMLAPMMIKTLRGYGKYYDIIHIHHPDPMATLSLFLSGFKGKVILHWHADILKQKILLKLYKPLQNWLIKRADVIVGTSPVYVAESPFLRKVQDKVDYIPIGILEPVIDKKKVHAIREEYKHKKLIFSLGRLVDYKGYEHLIRAASYLDDSYQILVGGKGPLEEILKTLIQELKLEDKVHLLGFLSDEEVPNYHAAADVFCLSSIQKTEAFAIVQLEAMACGRPVVSTAIPGSGVSWVNRHQESGLVVPAGDAKALAEACHCICEEHILKQKLSEGARKRYEENFTRDKMIEKCVEIYKKTI